MRSFFVFRVLIYAFLTAHIILSIKKIEVFPVFGWNLYDYTHPYQFPYDVKLLKEGEEALSLKKHIRFRRYGLNRFLRRYGTAINKHKQNKNSKEFKEAKLKLEKYILKHSSTPFSYKLIRKKVHLPLYVLDQKNSVLWKKTVIEGRVLGHAKKQD